MSLSGIRQTVHHPGLKVIKADHLFYPAPAECEKQFIRFNAGQMFDTIPCRLDMQNTQWVQIAHSPRIGHHNTAIICPDKGFTVHRFSIRAGCVLFTTSILKVPQSQRCCRDGGQRRGIFSRESTLVPPTVITPPFLKNQSASTISPIIFNKVFVSASE